MNLKHETNAPLFDAQKRAEKRRVVHTSEGIYCHIVNVEREHRVQIVDISPLGLGIVIPLAERLPVKVGDRVSIRFMKQNPPSFTVPVIIRNLREIEFGDITYHRLGVEFELEI